VTRPGARSPRGFTLVELLVGVVVSSVVVAGAIALLLAQKRSFQGSNADRAQQETARMALEEMSQNLRMAGYGVEPAMVFDFGLMTDVPMSRAPQGPGLTVNFGGDSSGTSGFACGTPVSCRDRADAPDEIAFQYRNPYFNHGVVAADTGSVTIAGPLNQPLQNGQVLQAVCYSGPMVWAYVTVAAEVPATTATGNIRIPLQGGANLDYPHQNQTLADTCFGTGQARLFKVERLRYFVQSYDGAGGVVAWKAAGGRPYLMLDRGLRDASGTRLLDVISPDVEDLQVSYVFPLQPLGQQIAGATSGTQLDNSAATGIDLAPGGGTPTYETPRLSPLRATRYPANIRAVRLEIVVRSPNPDVHDPTPTIPAAGNRPTAEDGQPGYRRMSFQTSVAIPNMESRAPLFPALGTGTDQINVGGG
jgi:type IV pilus assembly protein PilW